MEEWKRSLDESDRRAEHVDISVGDDESMGHEEGADDGKEGQSGDETSDTGEQCDAPQTSHGLHRSQVAMGY